MKIKLTREDILSSKVLPPNWYRCVIKSIDQQPSKTDNSTNTVFQFVVAEGPFKDTPLKKWYVNEKAPGVITGLLEAFLGREPKENEDIELDGLKGKLIDIKVKNSEYNGRLGNDVDGFRKIG